MLLSSIHAILGGNKQGSASVRLKERDGILSCFVSAVCEEGLDPDEGVLLKPSVAAGEHSYVAIENHSSYWCRPFFGTDLSAMPKRVQGLLICEGERRWRFLLPVCAESEKTLIRGGETGWEMVVYSNCSGRSRMKEQLACLEGEGEDPYELIRRCTAEAARMLGGTLRQRSEKSMPEIFEYLGWCSWDAFQIRVSHEGLLAKAKEFRDKGVPVRFVIVDDMWADVPDLKKIPADADFGTMVKGMHASALRTFEGDPDRFPRGMKNAVADLKAAGISHVGIWFPTTGYWHGFEPDGEAKEMEDLLAPIVVDGERLVVIPREKEAEAYFDRLCAEIKDWGADFVKIDNQGFLARHYRDRVPLGEAAHAIQRGIDRAAERHFDGALINCMGMPSECMFHRPTSAVSRCSDDFIPESRAWFSKNVLQCSYNGLLQGQYYVNDWDMWWTDDEQASKNSLCRAVSGGPIYVSDKMGRTRAEILRPLCFEDGRIPRCDRSAVPTADCLCQDPTLSGKPLKIMNAVGENRVLAVFNVDAEGGSVKGTVSPRDVGLEGPCVAYEYFSREACVMDGKETRKVELADRDSFRLYIFLPKVEAVTVLGRTDKFVGVWAVSDRREKGVTLYEGGECTFFSERPIRVFAEDRELTVLRKGNLSCVTCGRQETELRWETE